MKRWCLIGLVVCACGGAPGVAPQGHADEHGDEHDDEHRDEPAHAEMPTRVRLSAQVIADAGVKTEAARVEVLAPTVSAAGEIASDPERTAQVAARVDGIVESVEFREGDRVTKGQVLATIRAPGLGGLRADRASLLARAASARSNLARLETLAARNMASQQELAAARAEATVLDAEAGAAGQRLTALGLKAGGTVSVFALRAPLGGFAVDRGVAPGQGVTAEHMVASIVNLDEAWFVARVFEHTLDQVHVGAAVEVQLNAYPRERFLGHIDYIAPRVDPDARTIVARVTLRNRDDKLRLGLFGTALIAAPVDPLAPGQAPRPTLVVSRDAVTDLSGKSVVFVRHADDDFEVHEVTLGGSSPGKVEVLHGLREGELVVTYGVMTLKNVLMKGSLEDDHH
ncbi:MAG: efflux RND transporter periplasmic adaptor subunit [Nannocystis sp.]|uniref:efflux RND transporter periplasmic adaptor subunit n=1 Tax=Nannocystis sp. TaxID=1962667 RepID=UPI002422ADA3|nr:efflux RND transporter periplasmic adaptor subunit [Nannocystis sp.]MBK9752730.1 efflux RND transporter periplasmic adaptor subunit [Nannocystis sp.]